MKRFIMLYIPLLVLTACLFSPNEDRMPGDVFYLTDIHGDRSVSFRSGESFHMHFQLINTTDDSLDFSYTGPIVDFNIYQGLRRIVGVHDGLFWAHVVLYSKFAPGDTMKGFWIAPNPVISSSIHKLDPGNYRAEVTFPQFEELETDTITSINFTITE